MPGRPARLSRPRPAPLLPRPRLTVDLVVFVLPVLDGRHIQRGSVWEDEAIGRLWAGEGVKGGRALASLPPKLTGLVSLHPLCPTLV